MVFIEIKKVFEVVNFETILFGVDSKNFLVVIGCKMNLRVRKQVPCFLTFEMLHSFVQGEILLLLATKV